jgi:hypothetical protein
MNLTNKQIRRLTHEQRVLFYEKLARTLTWTIQILCLKGPKEKRLNRISQVTDLVTASINLSIIERLSLWKVENPMGMFEVVFKDCPGVRREITLALRLAYDYVTGKKPLLDWVNSPEIPAEYLASIRQKVRRR